MTDFYSQKRVESTESTEELKNLKKLHAVLKPLMRQYLKKLHAVLKRLMRKYLKKLHAARKPLTEKYLVMVRCTHHQHSASQRLEWVLVIGHANLVGSRKFFDYNTIQGTINFYTLCHSRVQDLQSIFSFRSSKSEISSPDVKESKVKHFPFKV